MAKLLSEDEEIKSRLEIFFLKEKSKDTAWLPYKISLESGDKKLNFEKTSRGTGDYLFAVTPVNEIENLTVGIDNLIKSKENKTFFFEPAEPSFELIIEKSFKGYSVTCWADAGNVISDHYTWDGFGIRFFTTKEKLKYFVEELIKEKEEFFVASSEGFSKSEKPERCEIKSQKVK